VKDNKLNYKTTISIIFVITLLFLSLVYSEVLKDLVRDMLKSDWLVFFIWSYIAGTFIFHRYFYSSDSIKNDSFIYQHFGSYSDTIFGIATYGFAASTSISLIKGLYLQTFYSGSYFNGFASFDLVSMALMTSFLLFYSLFHTTVLLKKIIFHHKITNIEKNFKIKIIK
jgi:hypothetical protein